MYDTFGKMYNLYMCIILCTLSILSRLDYCGKQKEKIAFGVDKDFLESCDYIFTYNLNVNRYGGGKSTN